VKATFALATASMGGLTPPPGAKERPGVLDAVTCESNWPTDLNTYYKLVERYEKAGRYDHDQLTSMARLLLIAGHETSANMISLGTMTLLKHPDQLAELKRDPGLAPNVTEELLRYLAVADLATSRIATTDVEIGGVRIREGEGIIAVTLSANRDRHRPGFVSVNIHASLDGTRVVNYAQWESREHLEAMLADPASADHIQQISALASSDPQLYQVLSTIER
jgi:quinol monooxygenase YgiN